MQGQIPNWKQQLCIATEHKLLSLLFLRIPRSNEWQVESIESLTYWKFEKWYQSESRINHGEEEVRSIPVVAETPGLGGTVM